MKKYSDIINNNDIKFKYQMLSRLQIDCLYFLGYGNRCTKYLWTLNVDDHIQLIEDLYKSLPDAPEWCTWQQIQEYKKQMKDEIN